MAIGVTGKFDVQWELLETSFPFALSPSKG